MRQDDLREAEFGMHPKPPDPRLQQHFDEHLPLQDALIQSNLPRRFQAMVLGLAAIKSMRNGNQS